MYDAWWSHIQMIQSHQHMECLLSGNTNNLKLWKAHTETGIPTTHWFETNLYLNNMHKLAQKQKQWIGNLEEMFLNLNW